MIFIYFYIIYIAVICDSACISLHASLLIMGNTSFCVSNSEVDIKNIGPNGVFLLD